MGSTVGAEDIGDVDSEGAEVETAGEEANDGHNNIVNKRINDGGEGATNGDTNCEINNAAAIDELLKFADKGALGNLFDRILLNWVIRFFTHIIYIISQE